MSIKFGFLCISILAVLACIHAQDIKTDKKENEARKNENEIIMKCSKMYNIKEEDAYNFLRDWTLSARISKKLKCAFGCIFENLGIIEKGKINWDNFKKLNNLFPNPKDRNVETEIIENCRTKVKDFQESCELGYNIVNCMKEEFIEIHKNVVTEEELPWFELTTTVVCQKMFHVNEKEAFSLVYNIPNKRNVKCMIRCMDEMMGYINRSTKKYDWNYREKIERLRFNKQPELANKAVEMLHTCKETVKYNIEDACESSYLIMDCYMKFYRQAVLKD